MTSKGKYIDATNRTQIVRKPDKNRFIDGDFDSVTQNIVLPSVVDALSPRTKTKTFEFNVLKKKGH